MSTQEEEEIKELLKRTNGTCERCACHTFTVTRETAVWKATFIAYDIWDLEDVLVEQVLPEAESHMVIRCENCGNKLLE